MTVPATNERASDSGHSTLHMLATGSNSNVDAVVHGAIENGLPPPKTYSLLRAGAAPLPGALVACGTGGLTDQ